MLAAQENTINNAFLSWVNQNQTNLENVCRDILSFFWFFTDYLGSWSRTEGSLYFTVQTSLLLICLNHSKIIPILDVVLWRVQILKSNLVFCQDNASVDCSVLWVLVVNMMMSKPDYCPITWSCQHKLLQEMLWWWDCKILHYEQLIWCSGSCISMNTVTVIILTISACISSSCWCWW